MTVGGGVRNGQNRQGRAPRTANPLTGLTFTESEERMLSQGHVRLHDLQTAGTPQSSTLPGNVDDGGDGIRKDVEIAVMSVPNDAKPTSAESFAFATGPMRKSSSIHLTHERRET